MVENEIFHLSRLCTGKDLNCERELITGSSDGMNAVYSKTRDKSLRDLKEAERPNCYILRSARAPRCIRGVSRGTPGCAKERWENTRDIAPPLVRDRPDSVESEHNREFSNVD